MVERFLYAFLCIFSSIVSIACIHLFRRNAINSVPSCYFHESWQNYYFIIRPMMNFDNSTVSNRRGRSQGLNRMCLFYPHCTKPLPVFVRSSFYLHGLTFIPAWISNYIHYNVCYEITYPFQNFDGGISLNHPSDAIGQELRHSCAYNWPYRLGQVRNCNTWFSILEALFWEASYACLILAGWEVQVGRTIGIM